MPKVSIILTSYNHEEYIRESIDSVLNQTFTDFELLIIDDASSDDSWRIINTYSDSRIKAFLNTCNTGTVTVLNKAISELVTGEYIAIHHSDDYWDKEKLEKQVKYLDEHDDVGAVFTSVQVVDSAGSKFNNKDHFYYSVFDQKNRSRYQWLNYFFYHGNCLCHPSLLVRNECYKNTGLYDYRLCQLPDYDMWIRIVLKYEIFILEEKLTSFRVTGGETSESGNRKETRIRSRIELDVVVRNFEKIKNFSEMLKIFPEAKEYHREEGVPIDFVLAMIALGKNTSDWVKNLGVDILFGLFSSPARAKELRSMYGFDCRDFVAITGKADLYNIDEIHELNTVISDCVKMRGVAIEARDEAIMQCTAVTSTLNMVYSSRSWKLTSPLRKIVGFFK